MTIVYRVENAELRGPYFLGLGYHNVHKNYPGGGNDTVRHPSPLNCGIGDFYDKRFGFESIESLRDWFNEEERQILFKHDYHISKYEVGSDRVWNGKRQLVFDPTAAVLLEKINICSL